MNSKEVNHENIKPDRIEKNVKPMLIAGISRESAFDEGLVNAPVQWEEFGSFIGKIPGQIDNIAYGLCFDMNNGQGIEYVTGVEVSDAKKLPENFITKKLPSFDYAIFQHKGHVSGIPQTCDVIWKEWIPKTKFEKPEESDFFFFERYGEEFDPETGTGDIEIWVPVKT